MKSNNLQCGLCNRLIFDPFPPLLPQPIPVLKSLVAIFVYRGREILSEGTTKTHNLAVNALK